MTTIHGQRALRTPTYNSWSTMRQRCANDNRPDYEYYGGRGIRVCDDWESFQNFLADMGKRPIGKTLDRKNVDGNYEPDNCRWASLSEQNRNKRDYRFGRAKVAA
jgi:hypothetical protein